MLTLNDGRSELWQWDTGRKLTVDADCSQVHFNNKVFGRSIDVDVVGGVAIIPDILLQTDKELTAWAFVGTAENGYTKISKTFKVNRRNKPADYVFTPVEQTTIAEIAAIAQSVRDDADAGLFDGSDGKNPVYGVDYGTPDQIADIANQAAGILADDIQNISDGKVDKVEGMGLSTNDYDNAAKAKVDAIPEDPKYTDTVYDDTEVKQNLSQIKDDIAYTDAYTIDAIKDTIDHTTNLFDLSTITSGKYVNQNGVEVEISGYCHSDDIPVNSPFCVTNVSGATLIVLFKDAQRNPISSLLRADATLVDNKYFFVIPPAGTEYIVCNFRESQYQQSVTMVTPWIYPPSYISFGEVYTKNNDIVIPEAENILSPTGDTTDRTSDILNALALYGECKLSKGDFYISESGVTMPDGSKLIGSGADTRIILGGKYDSTVGQCVTMGSDCTVSDITFMGWTENISLAGTIVERHGILWTADADGNIPYRGIIENCRFLYFKGGAITCKSTGSNISNCLNVNDCYMYYCRAGVNIDVLSEYHRFTNLHITACYYGVINNGGNNMFANCLFTKNTIGFLMDNTNSDKSNNSHGSAIGCTFNHSGNNSGIGVKVVNMTNGFVFSACQNFYSKIDLTDASGIVFDHVNFGNGEELVVNGGGVVLFDGCMFGGAPTKNITENSNVKFVNCYVRNTGAVVNN